MSVSAATHRPPPVGLLVWELRCFAARRTGRQLDSKIVRSVSKLPSAYNDFLYANVVEDANGALLTVLSMLARQDVDPWEEAADLSRLPRDTAARRLISMITASPGHSPTADQTAVADRLIALLPGRIASADSKPDALQVVPPMPGSPPSVSLMVIAIYIGVMVVSQWLAASIFEKTPIDVSSSPPSTLGETLPPTTPDGGTSKRPP
jgi:hypothetical protein